LEVHSNRLCSISGGVANFGGVPLTGALNTITDQTITMVDNDAIVRHTLTGETQRDGTTNPVKIGVLMVWHKQDCALSDILATSPDNFANNRIMMAIEYRRRDFYAFEFYRIWPIYNYIN
jgi:hypothetical protein